MPMLTKRRLLLPHILSPFSAIFFLQAPSELGCRCSAARPSRRGALLVGTHHKTGTVLLEQVLGDWAKAANVSNFVKGGATAWRVCLAPPPPGEVVVPQAPVVASEPWLVHLQTIDVGEAWLVDYYEQPIKSDFIDERHALRLRYTGANDPSSVSIRSVSRARRLL